MTKVGGFRTMVGAIVQEIQEGSLCNCKWALRVDCFPLRLWRFIQVVVTITSEVWQFKLFFKKTKITISCGPPSHTEILFALVKLKFRLSPLTDHILLPLLTLYFLFLCTFCFLQVAEFYWFFISSMILCDTGLTLFPIF